MNGWIDDFERYVQTKTAHSFLFHGNVADDMLYEGKFYRIYEIFPKFPTLQGVAIMAFFNLGSGLRFIGTEKVPEEMMKKRFIDLIIAPLCSEDEDPEEYFEANKHEISSVLGWCDALLHTSWENVAEKTKRTQVESSDVDDQGSSEELLSPVSNKGKPFAVVAFEYQETKTPPESATGASRLDRRVVETIQWWAQLPEIRDTNNLVMLFADSLSGVAPELHVQTKGIIPIEVPLPDREEQEANLRAFGEQGLSVSVRNDDEEEITIEDFARLTAGLSRVDLRHMFKEAQAQGKASLTVEALFEKKAALIQERLGDMVKLWRPPWGWEAIGGMDDRIMRFMQWAEAMQRGDIARLPKGGVLLVGAPGTGKTVCAEAFAHELDIPFLEIRNTMNSFVGQSERNIEVLLDTMWALRPCVAFMDEVDQLFLRRGEVYHGDSGVQARTSRMWMQFISDPKIHGQVFIFAATNHPELLDTAMKRAGRFGVKMPYLIPQKDDRPSIWQALFRKEVIRLAGMGIELDITQVIDNEELLADLSEMADFWVDPEKGLVCGPDPGDNDPLDFSGGAGQGAIPLTGAEMEAIIGIALNPLISQEEEEAFAQLPLDERRAFIRDKMGAYQDYKLTGEMLISAMKRYLPHEEVRHYKEMNDRALMSVDDLALIPESYRTQARTLRAKNS